MISRRRAGGDRRAGRPRERDPLRGAAGVHGGDLGRRAASGAARLAVMARAPEPRTWLLGRAGDRAGAGAPSSRSPAGSRCCMRWRWRRRRRRKGLGGAHDPRRRRPGRRSAGAATSRAWPSPRGNAPARALYARLGMAEAGRYHYRLAPEECAMTQPTALDLPPVDPLPEPRRRRISTSAWRSSGWCRTCCAAYAFDIAKLDAFAAMYNDLMLGPSGLTKLEREMIAVVGLGGEPVLLLPRRAWCGGAALSGDPALGEALAMNYRVAPLDAAPAGDAGFRGADDAGRARRSRRPTARGCASTGSATATSGTSRRWRASSTCRTGWRARSTCGRTPNTTPRRASRRAGARGWSRRGGARVRRCRRGRPRAGAGGAAPMRRAVTAKRRGSRGARGIAPSAMPQSISPATRPRVRASISARAARLSGVTTGEEVGALHVLAAAARAPGRRSAGASRRRRRRAAPPRRGARRRGPPAPRRCPRSSRRPAGRRRSSLEAKWR